MPPHQKKTESSNGSVEVFSPWSATDFWNLNGSQITRFSLTQGDLEHVFEVSSKSADELSIAYNGETSDIVYSIKGDQITTLSSNKKSTSNFFITNGLLYLFNEGSRTVFESPGRNHFDDEEQAEGSLLAPLHGKVVGLEVDPGDSVSKGQPLLIIEAMKMEHTILAPSAGIIRSFHCAANDIVDADQQLIEFEPKVSAVEE